MQAILASDIGTTAVKSTLFSRDGQILASASAGYPLRKHGVEMTQSPSDWWTAFKDSVRAALAAAGNGVEIVALSLTGQMQDVILVQDGEALAPAILYADLRAQEQAERIQRQIGEERLIQITANLQDASSLLAKFLWLRENQPQLYRSAEKALIGAHDTITLKLCGAAVSDYTTASTTGLFDFDRNDWAVNLLDELEIRHDWLPRLLPYRQPAGWVSPAAAEESGLPAGLPVYHGMGDAAATTIGAAAGEGDCWYVYLGTSGWLAAVFDSQPVDPRTGIFNLRHPDGQRIILIGAMLTAAGNFEWLAREFGELERQAAPQEADAYARLNRLAEQAAPGCNGVLFLPYLNGERAPFRDPHARGVWFGLSASTARAEMYRSVLEGVAFAMRTIRDAMPTERVARQISLVGGGARSALWAQIFADVFACPVSVLADPGEVATRGAFLAAAEALGWQPNLAPDGYFPTERTAHPSPEQVSLYEKLYPIFKDLYPALQASFERLSRV